MDDVAVPPAASTTTDGTQTGHGLRGSIGVVGIVFLVVAAAAPLTAIGGALPVMLAAGNGPGNPMSFVVATVVLLLFSVGYAAMSRHVVDAGAFYAYITRGLGDRLGTGAAGLALLGYTAIQAAVYGLAGATAQGLAVQHLGLDLPWWVWSLLLLVLVGLLGYRNIDVGTKVLGVVLTLEVAVVTVMAVAVLVQGGADGLDLQPFTLGAFFDGAPGISIMFAIASFVGFEATAIYGEEARDPQRTVPRATYAAVVLIGAFYAFASWAVVMALGTDQAAAAAQADPSAGLIFGIATQYVGTPLTDAMGALLLTSLFAALLAFHNAIARYLFSLGRQGRVPASLATSHPRHGSPARGSLVQTVCALVLMSLFVAAGADPILQVFTWASGVATVSVLVLLVLTSVAVLAFFHRERLDTRTWHTRVAPALGTVALVAVLALVLTNFTTLISGSAGLATVLLALVAAVFVGGVVVAGVQGRTPIAGGHRR
ncbi:amino acid/polyamine/organocation transporter, APC superfamily [Klenkia marina]|uniref:Amino acid/polyamine/organocation transporter, APC superfamily n=1 Tax=Klenkia marina TaxID=1960309 RepID=A0A1G4YNR1_9ACTN|nr:APC family permease [Klenkia marina]SCX54458.1 amino acid/polyamine/organocation transporter, APC superfamily [Klenkia marina]